MDGGNHAVESRLKSILSRVAFWVLIGRAASVLASEQWNPIVDLFGALPTDARGAIIVRAGELREKTGVALTVAVAPAATLEHALVRLAADLSGNGRWGLILAPTDSPAPRVVVGPALEAVCPPALARSIAGEVMAPHLRAGDLGTACVEGANAFAVLCARDAGVELAGLPRELRLQRPEDEAWSLGWIGTLTAGGILIGLGGWRLLFRRRLARNMRSG